MHADAALKDLTMIATAIASDPDAELQLIPTILPCMDISTTTVRKKGQ